MVEDEKGGAAHNGSMWGRGSPWRPCSRRGKSRLTPRQRLEQRGECDDAEHGDCPSRFQHLDCEGAFAAALLPKLNSLGTSPPGISVGLRAPGCGLSRPALGHCGVSNARHLRGAAGYAPDPLPSTSPDATGAPLAMARRSRGGRASLGLP